MADCEAIRADARLSAARDLQAEVVSPILRYDDTETVQQVVRVVRPCGAKVDSRCAIHTHVAAARFATWSGLWISWSR